MTLEVFLNSDQLFLSEAYLHKLNVPFSTTKKWLDRNRHGIIKTPNGFVIDYESIPQPTREILPSKDELLLLVHDTQKQSLEHLLREASESFVKHVDFYRSQNITDSKAVSLAKRHAVIALEIDLLKHKKYRLDQVLKAHNSLFPEDNYCYHYFSGFLKKARVRGIESVVFNGNHGKQKHLKITPVHEQLIVGTKLKNPTATAKKVHELVNAVLAKNGFLTISLRSVQSRLSAQENTLHETLKGQVEGRKRKAFMPLASVPYANNQWQMDGWTLPFYYKEDGKLKKLWLITVMDSHSRKIVGYHIDTSERLTSIKQALDKAIKETQSFAFELVADNHSSNQTNELKEFQIELENLGVTFTVDSNPQRKGKLERLFQVMDSEYFRYEAGWVGEGVKSKRKNARPKPEILDKYLSDALEKNQIIQTAIRIVETYNNAPRKVLGNVSPNHAYNISEKPKSIPIDDLRRIQLTTKPQHYKVSRGMIKVVRGVTERYFGYLELWEGKTLEVFTANDYESIYATDPKTGKLVAELTQISRMHPDLASQTHEDLEEKARYARHIKAVKKQREDALLDLGNKAKKQTDLLGIPAEAFNPLTHKKHQQLDPDIQHRINRKLSEEYDIDPEMTSEPEHKNDAAIERAFALINVLEKPKAKELNKKGSYLPVDLNKYRD